MRLTLTRKALPTVWRTIPALPGIVLETDIAVNTGRLRAKLLVLRNQTALRAFWKTLHGGFGEGLGRRCCGAVNALSIHKWESKTGRERIEADRRYFCVIGLVVGYLNMEIITHEAVHAACCWTKRRTRSGWDAEVKRLDEEAIAYPAGIIAAGINRVLHREGLFK